MDNTVQKVADYVKETLFNKEAAHDWWHILRVWNNAKHIASHEENANLIVVELAALLHDITDWKDNGGDSTIGAKLAGNILSKYDVSEDDIKHVEDILANLSFKGVSDTRSQIKSVEGKIVQDADRLDSMGAIGIARVFSYGGTKGHPMYDPNEKADIHEFGKRLSKTSINHFYEKLLLLKDLMNTETGKKIAEGRHKFMEEFLEHFYNEWEGKE